MKNMILNLMLIFNAFFSSMAFAHEGHTQHPHAHLAEYGVLVLLFLVAAWVCWNWFPRD